MKRRRKGKKALVSSTPEYLLLPSSRAAKELQVLEPDI
jgi:hypothetical protein